ncbi:hypothetical protein AB0J63_35680 [Streptosporangium canum]|uniref:hypothetical protein n=1 Tax=Streptosporangium canum TaxID=324952 RepID=UPI0034358F1A
MNGIFSLRLEVASKGCNISGTLLARQKIDGMRVYMNGRDQAKVLGVTQLVFQKMMIGYVDRMGGWRAPIWMGIAILPMLLVSTFINNNVANSLARSLLVGATALSALVIFWLSYKVLLRLEAFVLMRTLPPRRGNAMIAWIVTKYRIPAIKWIAGLIGIVLVSIISNKISDLIPWP